MNMLKYEYRREKNKPTEIRLEACGDMVGMTAAVGRLIQQLYFKTPESLRPMAKHAMQHLLDEDSPIWEKDEWIEIDMLALRALAKEKNDG